MKTKKYILSIALVISAVILVTGSLAIIRSYIYEEQENDISMEIEEIAIDIPEAATEEERAWVEGREFEDQEIEERLEQEERPYPTEPEMDELPYEPNVILVKFEKNANVIVRENNEVWFNSPEIEDLNERFGLKKIEPISIFTESTLEGGFDEDPRESDLYYLYHLTFEFPEECTEIDAADEYEMPPEIYAVREYKRTTGVEYASLNGRVYLQSSSYPNDPLYQSGEQWNLDKIELPKAWGIEKGKSNIIVANLETMDYNHVDIAGRNWINSAEFNGVAGVDDDNNGQIDDIYGWNFAKYVNGSYIACNDVMFTGSSDWHGTCTASIIAAQPNNGIGIAGITHNVKLMPVPTTGHVSDFIKAVEYGVKNGAKVSNASSVAGPYSIDTYNIIDISLQYAHGKGCVFVASAGNGDIDVANVFPAGSRYVISVANYDKNDVRIANSDYGVTLDVAAPGQGSPACLPNNQYTNNFGGTSASAPHVAGLAALLLSYNSNLTPEQVRQIIRKSADDVDVVGWDKNSGYGRINAYKALQMAKNGLFGEARITKPKANFCNYYKYITWTCVWDPFDIEGIVSTKNFSSYTLEYGDGNDPKIWTNIVTSNIAPIAGNFKQQFDPGGLNYDKTYTIRLRLTDSSNNIYEDRILIKKIDVLGEIWGVEREKYIYMNTSKTSVTVYGYATGPDFSKYHIQVASGKDPVSGWTTIFTNSKEVEPLLYGSGSALATLQLSAIPGNKGTIRLVIENKLGQLRIVDKVYYEKTKLVPVKPLSGWPKTFTGEISDFTVGDINGDGKSEIIFLEQNSSNLWEAYIHAYQFDGSEVQGWPVKIPEWKAANLYDTPLLFDMDSDGTNEVVISTFDSVKWVGLIKIYNNDGKWITETKSSGLPIIAYDVTGNDKLEIITVEDDPQNSKYQQINVYEFKNKLLKSLSGWPQTIQGSYSYGDAAPSVGDIDHDGQPEIVAFYVDPVNYQNRYIEVFNHDGTKLWATPVLINDSGYYSGHLILADINEDGYREIVRDRFEYRGIGIKKLFLDHNGNFLSGWDSKYLHGTMCVGDMDQDGIVELIYSGKSSISSDREVIEYKYLSGKLQVVWKSKIDNEADIFIADIDGNGEAEVILPSINNNSYCGINALNHLGNNVFGYGSYWPIKTGGKSTQKACLIIGDINNDTNVDVLFKDQDKVTGQDRLNIWDLGVPESQDISYWPMPGQNVMRSNCLDRAPKITSYSPTSSAACPVYLNSKTSFGITVTDPDKDFLQYTWKLDGKSILGANTNGYDCLFTNSTDIGTHTLEVIVKDCAHKTSHMWKLDCISLPQITKMTSDKTSCYVKDTATVTVSATASAGLQNIIIKADKSVKVGIKKALNNGTIIAKAKFNKAGTYTFTAQAKDINGKLSATKHIQISAFKATTSPQIETRYDPPLFWFPWRMKWETHWREYQLESNVDMLKVNYQAQKEQFDNEWRAEYEFLLDNEELSGEWINLGSEYQQARQEFDNNFLTRLENLWEETRVESSGREIVDVTNDPRWISMWNEYREQQEQFDSMWRSEWQALWEKHLGVE